MHVARALGGLHPGLASPGNRPHRRGDLAALPPSSSGGRAPPRRHLRVRGTGWPPGQVHWPLSEVSLQALCCEHSPKKRNLSVNRVFILLWNLSGVFL